MTWLNSITDSMDMNLGKLQETEKDRETWHATVHQGANRCTPLSEGTTEYIYIYPFFLSFTFPI